MLEINFNGTNLSEVCTISKIYNSILPERDNFTQVIPTVNGSYYTGFRYGEKVISVDIWFSKTNIQDYTNAIAKLAKVLNTSGPKKFISSENPDVYYFAVLDRSTDLEKIQYSGSTTLNFICHDPIAYSKKWETSVPNDRGVLNFNNSGTANAKPIVDATFKNKSCFFQITNQSGETVLIGKPKELDKPTAPETDIVVNDNCGSTAGFATLAPSLLPSGYEASGNYGVGNNGNGIVATNIGSGDGWHGASFKKVVGQDLQDFEIDVDFICSAQGKNYVIPEPTPLPPTAPDNGSGTCLGTYKVVNCGGLWVNRDANDSTPLFAMAPNVLIYPERIEGNWYYHTTKTSTTTITGWSYGRYLEKVSDSGRSEKVEEFAEGQIGTMEVYGFDRNGAKLFTMKISDNTEYFECNIPEVFVGGNSVVYDNTIQNTDPRVETNEDGDSSYSASGAVGRWNDCTGKFVIRRESNASGQQLWTASVNKYVNGRNVATISTNNSLSYIDIAKNPVSYLGFFIGGYGQNAPMSVMSVENIKVRKLNVKAGVDVNTNLSLFEAGDQLQVNFDSADISLNGQSILDKLDIGSKFFNVPSGESRIITRSDDKQVVVCAGIQERFI